MTSTFTIKWSMVQAFEQGAGELRDYWNIFRSARVGNTIFIFPTPRRSNKLYVLNLTEKIWRLVEQLGEPPELHVGRSIVLVDEYLLSLGHIGGTGAHRVPHIHAVDVPLKRWRKVMLYGEDLYLDAYHASDYWASQGVVLINTLQVDVPAATVNATYTLNVESKEVKRMETKGKPPSRRRYMGSCLLETNRLWVLVGGDGPDGMRSDIYTLHLQPLPMKPFWSFVRPFGWLQGISVPSVVVKGTKVLIIGGHRSSTMEYKAVVLTYDFTTGAGHLNGVQSDGAQPSTSQMRFHNVLRGSESEFHFVASSRGTCRCYRGELVVN